MEIQITNIGGRYQFWHTNCSVSERGGIMESPELLDNNVKKFKCLDCGKVGYVTIKRITTGIGTAVETEC